MTARGGYQLRVKICGLTNPTDALNAIALGADALGFNFFQGSKRYLNFEEHAGWIGKLPPFVTRVAVLVNVPLEEALRIAEHPAIDVVQLHGDEDEVYCAQFARSGRPFIKALRLSGQSTLAGASDFSTPLVLIDAHVQGAFGGTGAEIDLSLAAQFVRQQPLLTVILAGGLTPLNVVQAIESVRPYAVDVASGVELSAREKSVELMREFMELSRGDRLQTAFKE